MRPVPAGRQRGQCCTPYSRLQEEIDNVETIAVTANNTANNAANAANTAMAGLSDGSVTRIGTANVGTNTKPIKLVNGVPTIVANELMDLTTDYQMVTGEKWFLAKPTLKDVSPEIRSNTTNGIKGCDSDGITKASVMFETDGRILLEPGIAGTKAAQVINQRAYDPANTNDIATIGTLDAYTPMVRTSGEQYIGGRKNMQFTPFTKYVARVANNSTDWWKLWTVDATNINQARMWFVLVNGSSRMHVYVNLTSANNITISKRDASEYSAAYIMISVKNNIATFWVRPRFSTSRIYGYIENETNVNYERYAYWRISTETRQYPEPQAADYDLLVTATEVT